MSYDTAGPLSAERLNPLMAELEEWARELEDKLMRQFYESGHPVGTEKLPDQEVYARLVHLRDVGSPEFWQNPQAQRDLERLGRKFGHPGPVAVPQGPFDPLAQGPQQQPPSAGGFAPQTKLPQLAMVSPVNVPVGGPGVGQPAEYPGAVTGGR